MQQQSHEVDAQYIDNTIQSMTKEVCSEWGCVEVGLEMFITWVNVESDRSIHFFQFDLVDIGGNTQYIVESGAIIIVYPYRPLNRRSVLPWDAKADVGVLLIDSCFFITNSCCLRRLHLLRQLLLQIPHRATRQVAR